jgi:hypothetical protein
LMSETPERTRGRCECPLWVKSGHSPPATALRDIGWE